MSFFQNVFIQDFFADRHEYLYYAVPSNYGRGDNIVSSWGVAPFNLSGNDLSGNSKNTLTIGYAIDSEYKNWSYISINIASGVVSTSAVTVAEIVNILNNTTSFSWLFEAINSENKYVRIRQKLPSTSMRFYIVNGRAEQVLLFNKKAGVAEIHSDVEKHLISNRFTSESLGMLVKLDPANAVDANIIDNAKDKDGNSLGLNSASPKLDAALLRTLP